MIPIIRGGTSFRGAGAYYLHDKARDPGIARELKPTSGDRVAWIETRNCVNDSPRAALDEMWRTHADAASLKKAARIKGGGRAPTKPVKTIALSWHADEKPDRAAMRAAADDYLAAMGWQEHQAVIVCHTDTKHPHLHIILNRVHPVTGRTLDDSNDRPRSQAWALGYELAHGRVFCSARVMKAAEAQAQIEAARNARNRELVEPVTDIAVALSQRQTHAVTTPVTGRELSPEQRKAAQHLLQGPDLVAVTGYAGTGKTRLLERTRRGWEAQGLTVRGVTLSGIAARNLEAGSGIQSRTIASLEFAWSKGRDPLSARDILVVDEAGMVSAPQMLRLLSAARDAGAKVVLVGDPEQLQPINSPAPYRAIAQTVGGVELTEIHRQRTDWQRQATRELANKSTRRALSRYDGEGFVHEAKTVAEARRDLIDEWCEGQRLQPGADRIILAHRRADVARLNELARERMRETGALGRDRMIATASGDLLLAKGDAIVFGRNDSKLGVNNGTRATIESISEHRLTALVIEDGKRRAVSVPLYEYNAISYGYAMTVHKAQGVTVDAAHVLASRQYDRHIAYVALSRHRDSLHLHYATSDFASVDRLSETFARAPLPILSRAQTQPDDIFCTERLKRDYAADTVAVNDTMIERTRRRGAGAGHAPADHKTVVASERRFMDAEAVLEADALSLTPREQRDLMSERHKAERDHFFAERGHFIKALRDEVYIRVRADQAGHWREHHAFAVEARSKAQSYAEHFELMARAAVSDGDLDRATYHLSDRDAHRAEPEVHIRRNAGKQIEHQRAMIKARQNEACAAFINERYSDYAALKDRQQDERRDLKALQTAPGDQSQGDQQRILELTRKFAAPPLDEEKRRAQISAILDKLDLVRETVPGARPMASEHDPLRENEERALYEKKAAEEIDKQQRLYASLTNDADQIERGQEGRVRDHAREERIKSYAHEWTETATAARKAGEAKTQGENAGKDGGQEGPDEAERRAQAEAETQARAERQREAERMAREAEAERQRQQTGEENAQLFAGSAQTFSSVKDRWSEALGKHYDVYRPYESLARAAGYELELFQQERREVARKINAEQDPEMRRILILEDRAAIADYQSSLAERNARLSEVITGRFADPQAYAARQTAHEKFYQGMRAELTGEYGNVTAQQQDRIAARQRGIAADLKAEAYERRLDWERSRLGVTRTSDSQRARTQESYSQHSSQSETQQSTTLKPWLQDKVSAMDRKRTEERNFHTASRQATGTQATEADRTQTRENEERERHRHGHGRGR